MTTETLEEVTRKPVRITVHPDLRIEVDTDGPPGFPALLYEASRSVPFGTPADAVASNFARLLHEVRVWCEANRERVAACYGVSSEGSYTIRVRSSDGQYSLALEEPLSELHIGLRRRFREFSIFVLQLTTVEEPQVAHSPGAAHIYAE